MATTVRVAILGGGMAGLAAAWTLARASSAQVVYDVTVYEATWRLGGKCASGRDVRRGERIEEHGIHILMGFYSQVFRILRDVYRELDPGLGFRPFAEVLEPADVLQLPDRVEGQWTFWRIDLPTNDAKPGDADPEHRDLLGAVMNAAHVLLGCLARYEAYCARHLHFETLEAAVLAFGRNPVRALHGLGAWAPVLRAILSSGPSHLNVPLEVRRLWMTIYFVATNLLGIVEGGLFTPEAFNDPKLNAQDYRDWLKRIGGEVPSPELTWDSPVVRAIYDLVFSRDVGFAAGAALYDTILMLLLYAGHVFYRMAGTGDVIFGPLYFALRARNVHFRFQHVVTDVQLGAPGPDGRRRVERVALVGDGKDRTVEQLFVRVGGQWCWPSEPLVDSPGAPFTLVAPRDFDYVVSAIPVGALEESAPSLLALPAVAAGVAGMKTVATQSIQLQLDRTLQELGWEGGRMMLGSYDQPFNAAADMAQVIPFERVPDERAVVYLSDVYKGGDLDPARALENVRRDAVAWIEGSLPTLLPGFTWDRLVDPDSRQGSERFRAQYARANVTGTELYVASAPGTVALRPTADGAGVPNLALASDWVLTEENAGCVEGAARSGVKAAAAVVAAVHVAPALPAYVQNDDDWVFPGPVVLDGTQALALPYLADVGALTALCARFSIAGATIRPWLPAVPLVVVFGCGSQTVHTADPRYAGWGSLMERELGVLVPVEVEAGGERFVALLCPYLFVDNAATLNAGREVFGLPKELATFPEWPLPGPVPLPLTATSLVLERRGSVATEQPIMTITQLPEPIALAWDARRVLTDLWQALSGPHPSVSLVILKQFRAIEDASSACYQALVRCRIEPTLSAVALEEGAWKLTLPSYFFPTPGPALGLADGAVTHLAVKASLDFTLTLGEIVASTSSPPGARRRSRRLPEWRHVTRAVAHRIANLVAALRARVERGETTR